MHGCHGWVVVVAYVLYYYVIRGLLQPTRRVPAVVLREKEHPCEVASTFMDVLGSDGADIATNGEADYVPDQVYFIVLSFLENIRNSLCLCMYTPLY